jgi:hypothetical protein
MTNNGARERIERLLLAARRIADRDDPLGQRARRELVEMSGLSEAGIELGFERCLETHPSETEIEALIASVPMARRAHVILPANVFTAAHRAIALALASSERVRVRPSRRDPVLARLLHAGTNTLFDLVDALTPLPGDHVWAYGSDLTLAGLRDTLPADVVLHAHGSGFGLAVMGPDPDVSEEALDTMALELARSITLFDQRGCLSPRLAAFVGTADLARTAAERISRALIETAERVPLGRADSAEAADAARFRDAMTYTGAAVFAAGPGVVALTERDVPARPASLRSLHIVRLDRLAEWLSPLREQITAVGSFGSPELGAMIRALVPRARLSPIGWMQSPPFDGPADGRPAA